MSQVKLFHAARLSADENDVHRENGSNACVAIFTGNPAVMAREWRSGRPEALRPRLSASLPWISALNYAEKGDLKQGFPQTLEEKFPSRASTAMQYPKSISELLRGAHKRLDDLSSRLSARDAVLAGVRAALPAPLAAQVAAAGFEDGRLSIGVTSAAWASRLRYALPGVRAEIAVKLGAEIDSVRIRVVRP